MLHWWHGKVAEIKDSFIARSSYFEILFIGSSLARRAAAATPHWEEQKTKQNSKNKDDNKICAFISDNCKINTSQHHPHD